MNLTKKQLENLTIIVDFDPEGRPVFLCHLRKIDDELTLWAFFCPHCRKVHTHSPSEGHRAAHCYRPPLSPGGYWITRCGEPWKRKRLPWRDDYRKF